MNSDVSFCYPVQRLFEFEPCSEALQVFLLFANFPWPVDNKVWQRHRGTFPHHLQHLLFTFDHIAVFSNNVIFQFLQGLPQQTRGNNCGVFMLIVNSFGGAPWIVLEISKTILISQSFPFTVCPQPLHGCSTLVCRGQCFSFKVGRVKDHSPLYQQLLQLQYTGWQSPSAKKLLGQYYL